MVGVYGQPSMSLELRKQIAADFLALVANPAIVSRMKAAGQGMDPAGPEAFARQRSPSNTRKLLALRRGLAWRTRK